MFIVRLLRRVAAGGLLAWVFFSSVQATTPPTDPTARCNVIHTYEAVCGNLRTEGCFRKTGFNYSNLSHREAWDNFYNLCVGQSPYKDRHSHECIEHLSLASACVSTVEPLIEYTMAEPTITFEAQLLQPQPQYVAVQPTIEYQPMTVREEPRYTIVTDYELTTCLMLRDQRTKIDTYLAACGDIKPSECSVNGTVESEYVAGCSDKKPCQCVHDSGCGPVCPDPSLPAPPPIPAELPPGSGGGDAPPPAAPGAGETGGGDGSGAVTDSTFVLGGENKTPTSLGEVEGGTEAAGAKGCALSLNAGGGPTTPLFLLSLIFGSLALVLRRRAQ